MTFYFGILAEIDIGVSTLALALTIVFLTLFDVVTRALEYSVRNNQIYNKMLQKMYKELMTMGFVTLLITLYTAADQSSLFAKYSTEIDFMGYVTFFVAIFFVAHALYIMLLSMRTSRLYEQLYRIKVAKVIEIYTQSRLDAWQRFLFAFPYLPLSSVRQKLEFKIIHSLFRDTYWLPTNFDYGSYLSRSFEKYSLKMINIGWSSWVIVIILGFLNFLRVEFLSTIDSLSCTSLANDGNFTTPYRRLMHKEDSILPIGNSYDSIRSEYDSRLLNEVSHSCIKLNVILFLISGSAVVIYAFVLFITGRFYYQRLIERTGISSLEDYPKFLMFEESISLKISSTLQKKRKLEVDINDKFVKKDTANAKRRMSINTLRKNVNVLLKESHDGEEDEVFKKISTIGNKVKRRRSVVKKTMSNVTKKVTPYLPGKRLRPFQSLKSFGSMSSFFGPEGGVESISKCGSDEKGERGGHGDRKKLYSSNDDENDDDNGNKTNLDEKKDKYNSVSGPNVAAASGDLSVPIIYRLNKDSTKVRSTLQKITKDMMTKRDVMKRLGASMKNIGVEKKTPNRRRNVIINIRKNDENGAGGILDEDVDSLTSIEQFKLFKLKEHQNIKLSEKDNRGMMMSYLRSHNHTLQDSKSKKLNMKLKEDLSDIYFFENPDLYFKAVEYAIMLNSLYLSLWVCNFISVVRSNFDHSWIYQIIMLVPLLFVLPLLGEIVKVSSLLEAIADLDIDIIGAVLEEMEEKEILVGDLRQKILSRIVGDLNDKKEIVRRLFQEIDIDHNGLISQFELRKMLRALRLHYSDAKFLRLYKAIDDDLNGSISELELTFLIFPDMIEDEDIQQRRKQLRQASLDIDGGSTSKSTSKYRRRFLSVLTKYAHISPTDTSLDHAPLLPSLNKSSAGDKAAARKAKNDEIFQKIAAIKASLPQVKDDSDSDGDDDNDENGVHSQIKEIGSGESLTSMSQNTTNIKEVDSCSLFTSVNSEEAAGVKEDSLFEEFVDLARNENEHAHQMQMQMQTQALRVSYEGRDDGGEDRARGRNRSSSGEGEGEGNRSKGWGRSTSTVENISEMDIEGGVERGDTLGNNCSSIRMNKKKSIHPDENKHENDSSASAGVLGGDALKDQMIDHTPSLEVIRDFED